MQSIVLTPNNWTLFGKPTDDALTTLPISQGARLPGQPLSVVFSFPDAATGLWAGYLTSGYVGQVPINPIIAGQTLVVEGHVTAAADTVFNFYPDSTCPVAPNFRPYIEGAFLSPNPALRWWSNPVCQFLQDGNFALSVPFSPESWSDADGIFATDPSAAPGFAQTLAAPVRIGLTFGGGCFFGHGVNVSGATAQFKITKCHIE